MRTREEGAGARGRVRGEIDQLKDDEKKRKKPGNGTQEPVNKQDRERDPRTREQTARDRDPTNREEEREVQGESVDIRHAELAQRNRSNAQTKSSAAIWIRKASKWKSMLEVVLSRTRSTAARADTSDKDH